VRRAVALIQATPTVRFVREPDYRPALADNRSRAITGLAQRGSEEEEDQAANDSGNERDGGQTPKQVSYFRMNHGKVSKRDILYQEFLMLYE
jgi:hypothetical protein